MKLLNEIATMVSNTGYSTLLLIIYCLYIIVEIILSVRNKAFLMDEKPLTKQYLFKQALRVPLASSLYYGLFSWVGHTPQFNNEGFTNFIEISKLPIALLSLTIPLVIIVNSIHRTIQTDKQIEEAKRKNISDGFYSHFKHVVDYFTNLPTRKLTLDVNYDENFKQEFEINSPIHLYKFIYNNNNPINGVLGPDKNYINKLTDLLINIVDNLEHITPPKSFIDNSLKTQALALNKIEGNLIRLHKMMCIDIPSQDYHFCFTEQNNDYLLCTNFGSAKELAGRIEIIYHFILNILEITVMFDFNDSLREDTGDLKNRIRLLSDISVEIFDKNKHKLGVMEPTFVLEPHTRIQF